MTFADKFWSWYDRNFSKFGEINVGKWIRVLVTALGNLGFDDLTSPGGINVTADLYDWIDTKIGTGDWANFELYWPTGWDFVMFTDATHCANASGEYYFFRDFLGKDVLMMWLVKKLTKWGVNNPTTVAKVIAIVFSTVSGIAKSVMTKWRNARVDNKLDSIINYEENDLSNQNNEFLRRIQSLIGFKLI